MTAPVSEFTPDAISTATVGTANELTISIARGGTSFTAAFSPVPKIASTMALGRLLSAASRLASVDRLDHLASGCAKLRMRPRRVALQVRRAPEQNRAHCEAVLDQPPSCDESVAAVVALARDDQHVRRRVRKILDQCVGNRLARARHQRVRRDAVLLLAEAIEFAALGGIEQESLISYPSENITPSAVLVNAHVPLW